MYRSGGWRRLYDEELHHFPVHRVIKSRKLRWASLIVRMEEGRNVFKIVTGKSAGNRSLGRSRRRKAYNIRIDLN